MDTIGDNYFDSREARIAAARQMNLFSNAFMTVALDDPAACTHVLRILTGISDLEVIEIRTQYRISHLASRDAILDILAQDSDGRIYNVEIQRGESVEHARRTRLYAAAIDSELMEKGTDFDALPDLYVIYISETDIWRGGQTVYTVDKTLSGVNRPYDDGLHIIYVNAAVDDRSEAAALMQYFKTADPQDMTQGALSARVHDLKCDPEGDKNMCDISDKLVEYGERKRIIEDIIYLMKGTDFDINKIMDILHVPAEERAYYTAAVQAALDKQSA